MIKIINFLKKIFGNMTEIIVICFLIFLATLMYHFYVPIIPYIIFGGLFLYTFIKTVFGVLNSIKYGKGKNSKEYQIKQGRHHSSGRFPHLYLINKDKGFKFKKSFTFNQSSMYNLNSIDNYDVNKLYGFSLGLFSPPTSNSYRFGWNCQKENGNIQIFSFIQIEKKFVFEYLMDVNLNKKYSYELRVDKNDIYFNIYDENNIIVFTSKKDYTQKSKMSFAWKCFLYFGGNCVSPQDMILYE